MKTKKNTVKLTEGELKKIISESVKKIVNEEFGVDMEDTLAWVKKKKPNMSPKEQQRFAQNIINKRSNSSASTTSVSPNLSTYAEVKKAVIEYMNEKWPGDYENGKTHYKAALKALGFRSDGYDAYGANAYTNGKVRVTVYYDRGEGYWEMEESQGRSNTTDNFYNTSSEMHDAYGIYGRGSQEDPWNR